LNHPVFNTRIVESARDRDAASAETHATSAGEQAFQDGTSKLLARGMDTAEVAETVVNAIRNDEFWVLTHPEWKDVLTERLRLLIESNQLQRGFGG